MPPKSRRPPNSEQLARELAVRLVAARDRPAWGGYHEFRKILGPEQVALVDDPAPLVAADPGRRAGKTTAFLARGLKAFDEHVRAAVCYFAPSDEQGVDIVWEDIRDYNLRFGLGLVEHWSDRWWTLGGRRIEVLGFNGRRDVERARGRKFNLVWIDEAQLGPAWFTKYVASAVLPTTLDYRGQVYATGTPSEVAEGFFFDAIHGEGWSSDHHWTCAQNPFFIAQGRDPLADAREMYHLTEDSVTYRREWLGLWIDDPDALVYFIPDAAIVAHAGPWYGNVMGLDLGWKDHDAISATGVTLDRTRSHLRHMETAGQQTNHQLFRRLLELAGQFPGPTIRDADGNAQQSGPVVVYDPAGHATKKTIETFRSDAPLIHWVEAKKPEKVQYIEWLNNDLREGVHTVEPGCSMVKEAKRLRWKKPGKLAEDADHSDQGDAWLYGQRHVRDWLRRLKPEAAPREESPFETHMAKMRAAKEQSDGYFRQRRRMLG